jgi:hypothetical protein
MVATLSEEQRRLVKETPDSPIRLVDHDTSREYVLLRAEDFDRLAGEDYRLTDTYEAQFRSAFAAGWDDPVMDEYDNYDENYRKTCE